MQPIPYVHRTHPRARTLKIKIEPNGEVVVVSPTRVSQQQVAAFVGAQRAWIERTQAKLRATPKLSSETGVYLFGKRYTPTLTYSAAEPSGVTVTRSNLLIHSLDPVRGSTWQPAHVRQLERFLLRTARAYILPRTEVLAQAMNTSFHQVSLKQQKTRWGSCSSRGNLNFNWRLVHFAPPIIDYVIIHELAHRTHMDHSSNFWKLVARFDPEYQRHRGILKRAGGSVG